MLLAGKKGLVLNVTNKNSIGWAIAEAARDHGAMVGVGGQNERMMSNVHKLLEGQSNMQPFMIDFGDDEAFPAFVEQVKSTFGKIDFLVHSAAFAPSEAMTNPFLQTKREDFGIALDVSCYSLVKLCQALDPLFAEDASVMTLSYLGSQRAMRSYNVMGVAKAALESAARYLAFDLGERGIRVNVLSPGPMNTVAARGVKGLSSMIEQVGDRALLRRAAVQTDVGNAAVFLMSDLSKAITGETIYIDCGYSVVAL